MNAAEKEIIRLLTEITSQLMKVMEMLKDREKPYPPYVAKMEWKEKGHGKES